MSVETDITVWLSIAGVAVTMMLAIVKGARSAGGAERSLKELGRKMDRMSEKIDTVMPTVAAHDARIGALERRVEGTGARPAPVGGGSE